MSHRALSSPSILPRAPRSNSRRIKNQGVLISRRLRESAIIRAANVSRSVAFFELGKYSVAEREKYPLAVSAPSVLTNGMIGPAPRALLI
jgi:hypothetical protein